MQHRFALLRSAAAWKPVHLALTNQSEDTVILANQKHDQDKLWFGFRKFSRALCRLQFCFELREVWLVNDTFSVVAIG